MGETVFFSQEDLSRYNFLMRQNVQLREIFVSPVPDMILST